MNFLELLYSAHASQIFYREFLLEDVDASLSSLSGIGGFRKMMKRLALGFGLTGTIQRTEGTKVVMKLEGTIVQLNSFDDALPDMVASEMIGNAGVVTERPLRIRMHRDFRILPDALYKRTAHFSGNEWEIVSAASD